MWHWQDCLCQSPDLLPGRGYLRSRLQAAPSGFSESCAAAVSRLRSLEIRVLRLQPHACPAADVPRSKPLGVDAFGPLVACRKVVGVCSNRTTFADQMIFRLLFIDTHVWSRLSWMPTEPMGVQMIRLFSSAMLLTVSVVGNAFADVVSVPLRRLEEAW